VSDPVSPAAPAAPSARRPATGPLGLAAGLLALVGLTAFIYGALEIAATNPLRPIVGIGAGLLFIGYGVLLIALARGVFLGRRWSRGPAVAMSLIQLPVAWSFAGGETWWVALVLAGISVTVLVCLLIRSSTAVLVPDADRGRPPAGDGDQRTADSE
jgi:hypothetical protein